MHTPRTTPMGGSRRSRNSHSQRRDCASCTRAVTNGVSKIHAPTQTLTSPSITIFVGRSITRPLRRPQPHVVVVEAGAAVGGGLEGAGERVDAFATLELVVGGDALDDDDAALHAGKR